MPGRWACVPRPEPRPEPTALHGPGRPAASSHAAMGHGAPGHRPPVPGISGGEGGHCCAHTEGRAPE